MNRTPRGAEGANEHDERPADPGTRQTYDVIGDRLWLQACLLAIVLVMVEVVEPLPGWLWASVLGMPVIALAWAWRRSTAPGVVWMLTAMSLPFVVTAGVLAGPRAELQWILVTNAVAFLLVFEERFPGPQAWGVAANAAVFATGCVLDGLGLWTGLLKEGPQGTLALVVRAAAVLDLAWLLRHHLLVTRRFRTVMRRSRDEGWQAAAEREGFIADMSHEIRTPLVALTHVHEQLLQAQIEPRGRDLVQQAIRAGDHVVAVLNDALDLARIDAGRLELDDRSFCVRELVEETVGLWRVMTTGRPVTVEADVQLARSVRRGDRRRLKQVLMNLLSNAVKFTEQGHVRVVAAGDGDRVTFRIVDDGVGMTETQIARVFEAFTQADRSTGTRYGGTGLGLTISQRLVQRFGGQLEVASALGAGSEFRFVIPLPHAEPEPAEPPTAEVDRAPLRVLVAEDTVVNQWVMKRMLEELGHEVEVVGDGRAAVERWRAWQPDAILMDVEMPVMNGLTATRRIRAMEAVGRPEVAIVALSAHTMPAEVEICMRAGMNGHLAKPARSKELERALVTAVRVARSTLKTWNGIEVDTRPH